MKKINYSLVYAILITIAFLLVSLLLLKIISANREDNTLSKNNEVHQSGYQFISPLLECASPSTIIKSKLEIKLKGIIDKNIKNHNIVQASLYLRDLNNGFSLEIYKDEKFTPASLLKVPLMMAYFKLAESDPSILNKKLKIENSTSLLEQNVVPTYHLEIGKEYTVLEIINSMIIYSDNHGVDALLNNIDENALDRIYQDLNIKNPKNSSPENFMSVQEYSSFFRILYNASYLNKEMSDKALRLMSLSQYKQGLRADIPEYITISHKFGERIFDDIKQLHDCGVIYQNKNPYLLCVMTRGQNFNDMSLAIQELSNTSYKEFQLMNLQKDK
ncbi:class A beta-lactamase-related serine hydrolase [Patescibacteria group bacterium]|nr:class A beta-lactamase-related serine hydrolase [Patescibacteria group bacterium]